MKDSKASILEALKNILKRIGLLEQKEKNIVNEIRDERKKIEIEKVKENINNL